MKGRAGTQLECLLSLRSQWNDNWGRDVPAELGKMRFTYCVKDNSEHSRMYMCCMTLHVFAWTKTYSPQTGKNDNHKVQLGESMSFIGVTYRCGMIHDSCITKTHHSVGDSEIWKPGAYDITCWQMNWLGSVSFRGLSCRVEYFTSLENPLLFHIPLNILCLKELHRKSACFISKEIATEQHILKQEDMDNSMD